jgi:DNA-binding transcriptional LysR family regulator
VRLASFTIEQLRSFVAVATGGTLAGGRLTSPACAGGGPPGSGTSSKGSASRLQGRDGRRVRLTDAGRSLAEACQAALRAIEVVDDSAQAIKELRQGSLHVGASPTCATYYLPPLLAEFTRRHPQVRLTVAVDPTADLNRGVASGALDCAVIEGAPDPGLQSFELTQDELVLVVHRDHPLAHMKRVTASDFVRYRYLGRGPQWSAERTVRQMLGDAYDHVEVLNLGHPEYVRAATVAGLGFAALPKRGEQRHHGRLLTRLPVAPVVRPIITSAPWSAVNGAGGVPWEMLTGGDQPGSGKISRWEQALRGSNRNGSSGGRCLSQTRRRRSSFVLGPPHLVEERSISSSEQTAPSRSSINACFAFARSRSSSA